MVGNTQERLECRAELRRPTKNENEQKDKEEERKNREDAMDIRGSSRLIFSALQPQALRLPILPTKLRGTGQGADRQEKRRDR